MKSRWRLAVATIVVAALPLLPSVGEASVSGEFARSPRIDSRLVDLATLPSDGAAAAARFAGLPLDGDAILVEVLAESDTGETTKTIQALGGAIVSLQGGRMLAAMPSASLLGLAADPSVAFVAVPAAPMNDGQVDQGIAAQGVGKWHDAGFDGSGINVLVVDSAFAGLVNAQAAGVLPEEIGGTRVGPTCSFGLSGSDPSNTHGTAVAELVHAMAPGATLYLYRTCLVWDGPDIVRYARSHDIDLVTQSLAYFNTVPLDGRDPWGVFDHIGQLADEGVPWFNSAGNYRQRHWRGTWTGDAVLDFGGGVTTIDVPLRRGAAVYLRWDDWRLNLGRTCKKCATDLDLDLYLLDLSGAVVAASTTVQSSVDPGPPIEGLAVPFDGSFRIQVRAGDGQPIPSDLAIDLFVPSHDLPGQFQVFAGSLNDASTLDPVTSVGAVCWSDGSIRPYSSQGPTAGGLLKPDISAVDGVSTYTYGSTNSCSNGFLGTSAATPNAAGTAALLMQASGARGAEVLALLFALTEDLGPAGPDDRYGVGAISLGRPRPKTCGGLVATIVALPGQVTIHGTAGNDVIVGNNQANVILGGAGDDVICARGGDDIVYGQGDSDRIWGARGDDDLRGAGGDDQIFGGPGGDAVVGGAGADSLAGGSGDDMISGGSGDDILAAGTGTDALNGGRGTDECLGGHTTTHCET